MPERSPGPVATDFRPEGWKARSGYSHGEALVFTTPTMLTPRSGGSEPRSPRLDLQPFCRLNFCPRRAVPQMQHALVIQSAKSIAIWRKFRPADY